MNTQFWKGKNILLTGHTGFKGSWLSLWLQKLGANLIGFSKDIPTKPSLFELANVEDGMTSITGNVCNYEQIEKVFEITSQRLLFIWRLKRFLDNHTKIQLKLFQQM